LRAHPPRAAELAHQAVHGVARHRRHRARLHGRGHRRDRAHRPARQRALREHRRAAPAHGDGAAARRDLLRSVRASAGPSHPGGSGLRAAAAAEHRGERGSLELHPVREATMSSDAIAVLVTAPDRESADVLARALVEERRIACANVLPGIRSDYRWEGRVEEGEEVLLVLKTTRARFEEVRARVVELHPYEVPEVIALPVVAGHEAYLRWIADSV